MHPLVIRSLRFLLHLLGKFLYLKATLLYQLFQFSIVFYFKQVWNPRRTQTINR